MAALADVAGLFKVTLSSMVCPSTAPTTVVTANPYYLRAKNTLSGSKDHFVVDIFWTVRF